MHEQHTPSAVGRNAYHRTIPQLTPAAPLSDRDYLAEIAAIKREAASVPEGLSMCHISAAVDEPSVRVALGGRIMRLHLPAKWRMRPPDGPVAGGIRGKIAGFSAKSRLRLLQQMAQIDRRELTTVPALITLTYPGQFSQDGADWKRDLKTLHERLRRHMGPLAAFWKLEFQRRGAPHFHLLVYDPAGRLLTYAFRQWLSRNWYEIVGSGDERHLRAGTQVACPRSRDATAAYAAKYVGKPEDGHPGVGRYWGIWHPELLPRAILRVALSLPEFHSVARVLRKLLRRKGVRPGRCIFIDSEQAAKVVHWAVGGLSP